MSSNRRSFELLKLRRTRRVGLRFGMFALECGGSSFYHIVVMLCGIGLGKDLGHTSQVLRDLSITCLQKLMRDRPQ